MKKATFLFMLLTSVASMNANAAFPSKQWAVHISNFKGSIKSIYNTGYKNITYPITVLSGPQQENTYYSQYVYFKNLSNFQEGYYTGIQPITNSSARIIFSYFGKDGKVLYNTLCHQGADGGEGVSCDKLIIPFQFGTTYNLTIKLIGSDNLYNSWEGLVENTYSHKTYKIGQWATPKSLGYPSGDSIGFIETYSGIYSCSEIPSITAYFAEPIANPSGSKQVKVMGKIDKPYAVGVCKGKVGITDYRLNDGLFIQHTQGID